MSQNVSYNGNSVLPSMSNLIDALTIFYDDLKTPAYYQNNGNGGNEGIIGDNFIPKDNKVYNIFYKYQLKATLSSNF